MFVLSRSSFGCVTAMAFFYNIMLPWMPGYDSEKSFSPFDFGMDPRVGCYWLCSSSDLADWLAG